jgi:hypothetical protein
MNPEQGKQPVSQSIPQQRPVAQAPSGSAAHPQADVLYEGVMRHSASAGGYAKWTLVSVAGAAAAWGLLQIPQVAGVGWPVWLLALAGVPGLLGTYLRHVTSRYSVSMRRVEFERGVFSKQVDSLELWRVLDIRYSQSFLDRLLGNAKIVLIGTDQSDPEFLLYGLPNHRELFGQLREAVQAARHTSRPMEIAGHDGTFEDVRG